MIKRLTRLDVAVDDLEDAASVYRKNFGFRVTRAPDSDTATVSVGGAEIRLVAGALAGQALGSTGAGMCGLWLEAEDLDQVCAALKRAGHPVGAIKTEADRRILAVDPAIANQVPLYIFDRKA
jgi:predicted enzyme related to lactoylglutathione lyase